MKQVISLNDGWMFTKQDGRQEPVNIPHTWNAKDGTCGNNDYYRGLCIYRKNLGQLRKEKDEMFFLEFQGVNVSCDVYFNDFLLGHHEGGFTTFRYYIDDILLRENENIVKVLVDNHIKNNIYPNECGITTYGGIYRDVKLYTLNKNHFDIMKYGGIGANIEVSVTNKLGVVEVQPFIYGKGEIQLAIFDANNKEISRVNSERIEVINPHLWNGTIDPYLYTLQITLYYNDKIYDQITKKIGFKYFEADPKKGFILNDKPYPLRGISIHQDREGVGIAIAKKHMEEDIKAIVEMGANTVRMLFYPHDDYYLELCDKYGLIVYADCPYIYNHLPKGNDNIVTQFTELVLQQKHHVSVCFWGLSTGLQINRQNKRDVEDIHKILVSQCNQIDAHHLVCISSLPSYTPLAEVNKVIQVIVYNLQFGKYNAASPISRTLLDTYHVLSPNKPICLSTYGEEGNIKIHKNKPYKNDGSEEFQLIHHENMIKYINKRSWLLFTHTGPLFDYSNSKKEREDKGIENTGLIAFDHVSKKDAYYLYKAYWTKDLFVHIAGKRFENRIGLKTIVRIISNEPILEVFVNSKHYKTLKNKKMYTISIPLRKNTELLVKGLYSEDKFTFKK